MTMDKERGRRSKRERPDIYGWRKIRECEMFMDMPILIAGKAGKAGKTGKTGEAGKAGKAGKAKALGKHGRGSGNSDYIWAYTKGKLIE